MNKYLNYFDGVYYINMDDRLDRKEKFEKMAQGLNIPAIRVSAVIPLDQEVIPLYNGHNDPRRKFKISCTMSHQLVIKMAKENGFKNCLIFEDDCVLLDSYKSKIQQCVDELKNIKWDLFYLGGEPNNYCEFVSDNLQEIKNGGVYCTHAYAINNTLYDKVLNVKPHQIDVIDILYLNFNKNDVRCILSKELLAIQDNGYSDIWDYMRTNDSPLMVNAWDKYIYRKEKNI